MDGGIYGSIKKIISCVAVISVISISSSTNASISNEIKSISSKLEEDFSALTLTEGNIDQVKVSCNSISIFETLYKNLRYKVRAFPVDRIDISDDISLWTKDGNNIPDNMDFPPFLVYCVEHTRCINASYPDKPDYVNASTVVRFNHGNSQEANIKSHLDILRRLCAMNIGQYP